MADLHQADRLDSVQESKENKLNIKNLVGVFLEEYKFDGLNPKPILGEHQYEFYNNVFGLWKKIPDFNSFTRSGEALVDLNSGKQYKVLRSLMNIVEVRDGKLKLDLNKYYLGEVYYFTVDQVEFTTFRLGDQTLTLYRSSGTEGHWLPLTEDRLRELRRKGYLDLSKLGYKTYKIEGTTESLVEITRLDPKVEVRVIESDKLTKLEDLLKELDLWREISWKKISDFNLTKYDEALVDLKNSDNQYEILKSLINKDEKLNEVLKSLMNIVEVRDGKLKLDLNKYYLGKVYYFTVDQVEFTTFRLGDQTLTLYRSPGTEGHWLPLTEDRLRELGRKGYLDLSKLDYKTYKIEGTTESLVEITRLDPKVEVRVIEYDKLTKLEDLLKELDLWREISWKKISDFNSLIK
jgi:hypothetical protein